MSTPNTTLASTSNAAALRVKSVRRSPIPRSERRGSRGQVRKVAARESMRAFR